MTMNKNRYFQIFILFSLMGIVSCGTNPSNEPDVNQLSSPTHSAEDAEKLLVSKGALIYHGMLDGAPYTSIDFTRDWKGNDDDLKVLLFFTDLKEVIVNKNISAEGWNNIKSVRSLKYLDVTDLNISNDEFKRLRESFPNAEVVNIDRRATKLIYPKDAEKALVSKGVLINHESTDENSYTSADFTRDWKGNDDDLRFLVFFNDLEEIHVHKTISTTGWSHIKEIDTLKSIDVTALNLTKVDFERLQNTFPNARVSSRHFDQSPKTLIDSDD